MLIKTGKYFVRYHHISDETAENQFISSLEYTFTVPRANSFAHAEMLFNENTKSLHASIHRIDAELVEE